MYLGHNVSSDDINYVSQVKKNNGNCYQIFLRSPQIYDTRNDKSMVELQKIKEDTQKHNMKLVVHASFLLNFCHPPNSPIHKTALKLLITDLNSSVILGAEGVIVHMGKNVKTLNLTNEESLINYVKGIETCLEKSNPKSIILFETGAGQGTEICSTISELGKIKQLISNKYQSRIGYCIDTCHIYSAGYDIGNKKFVKVLIKHISIHLGWKNVKCIHLNDSKNELNCRKDRHADIGMGHIKESGLLYFLKYCIKKGIMIILETPCDSQKNNKIFDYSEQIKYLTDKFT